MPSFLFLLPQVAGQIREPHSATSLQYKKPRSRETKENEMPEQPILKKHLNIQNAKKLKSPKSSKLQEL